MNQEEKWEGSSADSTTPQPTPIYEIRVAGCMDRDFWSGCFDGMEISLDTARAETILRGPVTDQAELYGLLSRLRDIGVPLISVEQIQS